jgi:hypothetical protein
MTLERPKLSGDPVVALVIAKPSPHFIDYYLPDALITALRSGFLCYIHHFFNGHEARRDLSQSSNTQSQPRSYWIANKG